VIIVQDAAITIAQRGAKGASLIKGVLSVDVGVTGFGIVKQRPRSSDAPSSLFGPFSLFGLKGGPLGYFHDYSLQGLVHDALVAEWGLDASKVASYDSAQNDHGDSLNSEDLDVLVDKSGATIKLKGVRFDRNFGLQPENAR
jgi:hypothetical protein